ncbi:hypothetical protein WICPIJ_002020 [Wickerhamomyces pijperi]|uniref:Phosphatidic acid phosphatase type 2/haloperoxidase domain-containing protein n=1 Tax=Wickerhamomyces pijperi TaxID=599730 RepID=A0A9P8QCI5_WICPI|nr:hypothetical protein WICPIJ_002020 [Wickerhamomyces pijperi]
MALNRISLGFERLSFFPLLKKWRVGDVLLIPVLFLINSYIATVNHPFERQFVINDITINHPFTEHERVPNQLNVMFCLFIPIAIMALLTCILGDRKHRAYLGYVSILGLCVTFFTNELITDILKNWIGRHRPDFIARCIPRDDAPRDVLVFAKDVCTQTKKSLLDDGFRTTPSGHSSAAFSSLGYLSLWLHGQFLANHPLTGSWRKLVAIIPIICASLIALSRTEDYRHHFVDVIIGGGLGFYIGHWTYRRNFPALDSPIAFKPYLDDSDVGQEEIAVLKADSGVELDNESPLLRQRNPHTVYNTGLADSSV